jgi:hypothetical protein
MSQATALTRRSCGYWGRAAAGNETGLGAYPHDSPAAAAGPTAAEDWGCLLLDDFPESPKSVAIGHIEEGSV